MDMHNFIMIFSGFVSIFVMVIVLMAFLTFILIARALIKSGRLFKLFNIDSVDEEQEQIRRIQEVQRMEGERLFREEQERFTQESARMSDDAMSQHLDFMENTTQQNFDQNF